MPGTSPKWLAICVPKCQRVVARRLLVALILFLTSISTNAFAVILTPFNQGRYLPGLFDQAGFVSVGQGQASWHAFDISALAGIQVGTVTYQFTQIGTTNPGFFPLPMAVYDVSTPYSLLSIDRIPIDSEGEAIAADLHSGNVYATFTVFAATEGIAFDISLGQAAIEDLQAAIDAAQQFFSLGVANTNFDAVGYFTPANATVVVTEAAVVPEPGSLLVLGTGLLVLLMLMLPRKEVSSFIPDSP